MRTTISKADGSRRFRDADGHTRKPGWYWKYQGEWADWNGPFMTRKACEYDRRLDAFYDNLRADH